MGQSFVWGKNGEKLTPDQVDRQRIASLLMSRDAQMTTPVASPFAGVNRALQGFISGRDSKRADTAENAGNAGADASIAGLLAGLGRSGGSMPSQGGMGGAPWASQPPAQDRTALPPGMGKTPLGFGGQGQAMPPVMGGDAAVSFGMNGQMGEMTLPQMRTMDPSHPAPIADEGLSFGGQGQAVQPVMGGDASLGFGDMQPQGAPQGGGAMGGGAQGAFASTLLAGGLPQHVVDGILMNARDESGFNPTAVGDGGAAFGLLQWNGPRKAALHSFAAQMGGNPADPAVQAKFTLHELQGPEAAAGRAIMSTQNAGEAGAAFVNHYERPAEQHRARREAAYLGGQGQTSGGMPTGGGTYPTGQGGPSIGGTGGGMDIASLLALSQDPWVTKKYGGVIDAMMGQQFKRQDADYDAQLKQSDPMYQAQLAQLTNPDPFAQAPAGFRELDMRAQAAGLQPGSPEYQQFMASGGAGLREGRPAAFESLHQQALAAGLAEGSPEYQNFMLTKGTGDAAYARETGTQRGQAAVNLDGAIAKGQQALDLIDQISGDPALAGVTGMIQGRLPTISQGGTDLRVKIDQLQGKAFLEAFESLKGGGAITEMEGAKAQAAMARLDQSQSTEAYQAALSELKEIVRIGMDRARQKAGVPQGQGAPAPATGNRTGSGVTWSVAP